MRKKLLIGFGVFMIIGATVSIGEASRYTYHMYQKNRAFDQSPGVYRPNSERVGTFRYRFPTRHELIHHDLDFSHPTRRHDAYLHAPYRKAKYQNGRNYLEEYKATHPQFYPRNANRFVVGRNVVRGNDYREVGPSRSNLEKVALINTYRDARVARSRYGYANQNQRYYSHDYRNQNRYNRNNSRYDYRVYNRSINSRPSNRYYQPVSQSNVPAIINENRFKIDTVEANPYGSNADNDVIIQDYNYTAELPRGFVLENDGIYRRDNSSLAFKILKTPEEYKCNSNFFNCAIDLGKAFKDDQQIVQTSGTQRDQNWQQTNELDTRQYPTVRESFYGNAYGRNNVYFIFNAINPVDGSAIRIEAVADPSEATEAAQTMHKVFESFTFLTL